MRSIGQTTESEYDFCTKGYALTLSAGMDMKAGYRVERGYNIKSIYGRDIQLLYLIRSDNSVAAGILAHEVPQSPPLFLCIPTYNSDQMIKLKAKGTYIETFIKELCRGNVQGNCAEFEFLYECLQQTMGRCKIH